MLFHTTRFITRIGNSILHIALVYFGNQMIRTMYDSRRCIRSFAQDDSRKKVDDSRTDGDDSRKRAF